MCKTWPNKMLTKCWQMSQLLSLKETTRFVTVGARFVTFHGIVAEPFNGHEIARLLYFTLKASPRANRGTLISSVILSPPRNESYLLNSENVRVRALWIVASQSESGLSMNIVPDYANRRIADPDSCVICLRATVSCPLSLCRSNPSFRETPHTPAAFFFNIPRHSCTQFPLCSSFFFLFLSSLPPAQTRCWTEVNSGNYRPVI